MSNSRIRKRRSRARRRLRESQLRREAEALNTSQATHAQIVIPVNTYGEYEDGYVSYLMMRAMEITAPILSEIEVLESSVHELVQRWNSLQAATTCAKNLRQLGHVRTEMTKLNGQLKALREKLSRVIRNEPALREQYCLIRETPRVENAFIQNDMLAILTMPLFGKDLEKKWHRVGPYEIRIPLLVPNQRDIVWWNREGPQSGYHGPPNIGAQGNSSCIGNASPPLDKALRAGDYATAVAICVRYPECAGGSNRITFWPTVPVEQVPDWYLKNF